VLDANQVQLVMNGIVPSWPKADKPSPADGAMLEETSTFLNWRAGMGAVAHDVYFGTTADLGPDQLVSQQQTDTQHLAAGLVPDQTYYWRIDETDADGIVSTGDVWSIWTPPKSAYNPEPEDGQPNLDTEADLSWTGGWAPIMHAVYFGTDADTVANAAGAPPAMDIGFDPGPLELETTYYWRVDEFYGTHWATGPVWSFSTLPPVPLTDDPNLVALYPLDEGAGKTAIDWSGHNAHGILGGNAQWVEGIDGGALAFGSGDFVEALDYPGVTGTHSRTVTAWIKTADYGEIASWGQNVAGQKWIFRVQESNGTLGAIRVEVNGGYQVGSIDVRDGEWHHVAAVLADDGSPDVIEISLYVDGCLETISAQLDEPIDTADGVVRIGQSPWGTRPFMGLIDDVHIYDKVFTRDEMRQTFGNVLLAWVPSPVNYETDVPYNAVLSWTPGDDAAQHDMYIGADEQAVADADASDTTGIYQGRQDLGNESFSPALELEQTYYWRIDENNSDGTISKGRLWTFAVVDAIVVDDFEDYNDLGPNEIFATWIDGYGSETNGALISSVETGIVHGGSQSMPYFYDNNLKYSEATMTLIDPRDWTEGGAGALSLWYRGYPASTGSFAEDPAGTYTMTASGADIWGEADEFHFAFKQLGVGPCTIIAKVESVDLTNNWAKAGVMVRDSLDAGSKFAAVYITPTNDDGTATNGCRFQARLEADVDAVSDTSVATDEQKVITAPYWVKLERGVVPFYNGYYSLDGVTWVPMPWNPQIIPTDGDDYIGLALTSHDAALTCEAVLSNVEITGTVGAEWTSQDIGISSNAREPMYVSIANQISPAVAVYNDDPNASTTDTWTEWVINLQDFAAQGVDLTDVDRISIGFGDKDNVQAGGSGMVYIDDIRLFRPPELVAAFAFGSRLLDCPTFNDPAVNYTMVHHVNNEPGTIQYDPAKGYGYEVVYPEDSPFGTRNGFGVFGPFDDSANNRGRFPDECPEQLYDSFIGAKDFTNDVNEATMGDMDTPGDPPEGIIFRVDVPNGFYRFVGAFGEADNRHACRMVAEDGGSGPPENIGNHVVLVSNHDQAQQTIGDADAGNPGEGVFARVGFDGRIPPPGDGVAPSPQFVDMDENGMATAAGASSPILEVTQGYIRIHQLQGNSNDGPGGSRDPNGGDIVILELWKID